MNRSVLVLHSSELETPHFRRKITQIRVSGHIGCISVPGTGNALVLAYPCFLEYERKENPFGHLCGRRGWEQT